MLARIVESGQPGFQLRRGEEGISVFDRSAVEPPLSNEELLSPFRPGSVIVNRTEHELVARGLEIKKIPGADILPLRLRDAHCEIRSGPHMTRQEFKRALKELD